MARNTTAATAPGKEATALPSQAPPGNAAEPAIAPRADLSAHDRVIARREAQIHDLLNALDELRGACNRLHGENARLRARLGAERAWAGRDRAAEVRGEVAIFGASTSGMRVWEALAGVPELGLRCFADNDPERQREELPGIPVVPAAELDHAALAAIIVASGRPEGILAQLSALGVPPGKIVQVPPDFDQGELQRRLAGLVR